MEDMKEIIREYVVKEYVEDDSEIGFDTPLISGGIVDSFSMVSLKRFLENKYNISIPDDKVYRLDIAEHNKPTKCSENAAKNVSQNSSPGNAYPGKMRSFTVDTNCKQVFPEFGFVKNEPD
jgi:acyl carrier protein